MSAPSVIASATLTFGADNFKVKSIPGGKPQSAEPVDVTCCDDSKKQFVPGALVVNGEIAVTVAGNVAPALNAEKSLKISLGGVIVDCGMAVARSVEPSTLEADNARERTWSVTFQPTGKASSQS